MTPGASDLIEIFSAIQGEGPIIGRRQIFLRFGHCDVVCHYCDTPLCHVTLPRFRAEQTAGRRDYVFHGNPASDASVLEHVLRLASQVRHHSVSLTGGEPLLHADAILRLAPSLKAAGMLLYLETNGHLVEALDRVAGVIDVVGMDVKIPSTAGFPARFDANRAFLALAADLCREVFVKIVVGAETGDEELEQALRVVVDAAPDTTTVLQPVTPFANRGVPPSPERMLELDELAVRLLPNALVIPQTHKLIGQA